MAADIPPEMPHWWDGFVANAELVLGGFAAGVLSLLGWVARLQAQVRALRGIPDRVAALETAEDAHRTTLAVVANDVSTIKAAVLRLETLAMRGQP